MAGPTTDPDGPIAEADSNLAWLEPIPDRLVTPESDDPATVVVTRESLRLALIASVQYLPPRQRVVFLLRQVLEFPAAEVSGMLGISTAAVKSILQRARKRMQEVDLREDRNILDPADPRARELLDQYTAAFETSDLTLLEKALRTDAAIELTGTRTWFSGRTSCLRYLSHVIGSPGDWSMIPVSSNGQPAAASYRRGDDGTYHAFGVAILSVASGGIARITVFASGPDQVARFGLPPNRAD